MIFLEKIRYFLHNYRFCRQTALFSLYFFLGISLFFLIFSPSPPPKSSIPEEKIVSTPVISEEKTDKIVEIIPISYITKVITIRSGDTLLKKLLAIDVDANNALDVIRAAKPYFLPTDLAPGQAITAIMPIDSPNMLHELQIHPDPERYITVSRSDEGQYTAGEHKLALTPKMTKLHLPIDYSLFSACIEADVPIDIITQLINTYSYDIDFQRDIHKNDSIELLFEKLYNEHGEYVKSGDLLYASLNVQGEENPIYLHRTDELYAEYYTPDGRTVRKSLMKTPINGARLSSGYGKRHHPVLGYNKMHKGLDFAAPRGTPFFAAGDGTIVKIGRNGAYGNYIKIRHSNEYSTAYAHAKSFARGLKKGDRVKQGQIIAYVGTTGRSTGPHLHYELLKSNHQINPSTVTLPSERQLAGLDLEKFNSYKQGIDTLVASLPNANETLLAAK